MHFLSNTMTYKLTNHAIRMCFTVFLNRVTYITKPLSMNCIFNSLIKRFFSYLQQLHDFRINFTYTERISRITTKTIHKSTTVHRNNITVFQRNIIGNPMNDLVINRCT